MPRSHKHGRGRRSHGRRGHRHRSHSRERAKHHSLSATLGFSGLLCEPLQPCIRQYLPALHNFPVCGNNGVRRWDNYHQAGAQVEEVVDIIDAGDAGDAGVSSGAAKGVRIGSPKPGAVLTPPALDYFIAQGGGQAYVNVAPQSFTRLSVTWTFDEAFLKRAQQAEQDAEQFQKITRYIVTVEKVTDCGGEPLVKFKVPFKQICHDECNQTRVSLTTGATQTFRVKVCTGDLLRVAITPVEDDVCPPLDPCPAAFPEPKKTAFQAESPGLATIYVYLS